MLLLYVLHQLSCSGFISVPSTKHTDASVCKCREPFPSCIYDQCTIFSFFLCLPVVFFISSVCSDVIRSHVNPAGTAWPLVCHQVGLFSNPSKILMMSQLYLPPFLTNLGGYSQVCFNKCRTIIAAKRRVCVHLDPVPLRL